MGERRPKLLYDATAAIDAAHGFVGSASQADHDSNLLLRSGVERQLEILGEACARLAKEDATLLTQMPRAAWPLACATASFMAMTR